MENTQNTQTEQPVKGPDTSEHIDAQVSILSQRPKWRIALFILSVLLPMAVGVVSSLFSKNGMDLYNTLEKPPLSPPAVIFPIAWTILYFMMGVAHYYILVTPANAKNKVTATTLYYLQLAMNFFWSIIFFNLHLYTVAFIWLIVMYMIIILCTGYYFHISKKATWLMVPYNIWMAFAAYLNLATVIMTYSR